MNLSIVILAAGQGRRMHSTRPKVLQKLAGRSLLEHVYKTALSLPYRAIYIVYGYGGAQLKDCFPDWPVTWIWQQAQLGTGHAVKQALPKIPDGDEVLVLYGDVPLLSSKVLQALIDSHDSSALSLLTARLADPTGYGRIIRDRSGGAISHIVEEQDASAQERAVQEVNTGILLARAGALRGWLDKVDKHNRQGEYYLTDIVKRAVSESVLVNSLVVDSEMEVRGVNDRLQLAAIERYYQKRQAHALLRQGLGLVDPGRFDLRGELQIGRDNSIDINVIIAGRVELGERVNIGPNCIIKDAVIGNDSNILANCIIEGAVIGEACQIGPFARIRPDTILDAQAQIGNFVEIKHSKVGKKTKINHLSYIGDSELGEETNIGAGVITCNYNGENKHKTMIGDRVFVGSGVQLIAPVKVEHGATIAAGSTITQDVEGDTLAIARTAQQVVHAWKRRGL